MSILKKFIKFLLSSGFYTIAFSFGRTAVLEKDYILFFPAFTIGFGAFCLSCILFRENFFSNISYNFNRDGIIIKNKGNILRTIPKSEIKNLRLTYDTVMNDLQYLTFNYKGKYNISAKDIDKIELEKFLTDLEYDIAKNHWYHILETLIYWR